MTGQGIGEGERRATRRRGPELDRAILEAAAHELTESGYPGMTMDRVAARAGTSKNVIYRRWPSRAALAVAAYRRLLTATPQAFPDTGSLRSDALTALRSFNDRMASPRGRLLRGLLTGINDDPDRLREIREQLVSNGAAQWLTILARAVARGEAPSDAVNPRVATAAVDLLRNEYALHGVSSIQDEVIVDIVDRIYLPLVRGYATEDVPEAP